MTRKGEGFLGWNGLGTVNCSFRTALIDRHSTSPGEDVSYRSKDLKGLNLITALMPVT